MPDYEKDKLNTLSDLKRKIRELKLSNILTDEDIEDLKEYLEYAKKWVNEPQ